MDGVKFGFNDIISFYKKNDSERKMVSQTKILPSIFDDIIVNNNLYIYLFTWNLF